MPALSDYVPGASGASYDWIGFDPRGVGASRPSLHCSRSYFGDNRPNYVPSTPKISATGCSRTATTPKLREHRRQARPAAAHDHPRHRARHGGDPEALGVETISYYGFSYGTYLGQVYATRYPTRVGRFVLDGVVNPSRVWYAANLDQDRGFDANMHIYWRYLAAHPGAFHLGKSWRAIKRGYYRTLRRLDRRPAAGGRLGPDELADAMLNAGYYVYDWDVIGQDYSAWSAASVAARCWPATATRRWVTTTASRSTTPCSAPTRPGPAGHARARLARRSTVTRLPDLGQHLVQRAVPDLARPASQQARLSGMRSPPRCC